MWSRTIEKKNTELAKFDEYDTIKDSAVVGREKVSTQGSGEGG